MNQLTNIQSGGPTRFAGWTSETGTVKIVRDSVTNVATMTLTNFVGSANLSPGSNVVSIIASDSRTNLAINSYGVVVTNGLPTTLKYDANGNLTNQYTSTYTNSYDWDGEDRLIRITRRSTADPVEYKTEFLYDGLGRRVQIIERTNGVVASAPRYLWCGTELCEARGSGGGTATRQYVSYGEHQVGTGFFQYTFDHLGSVREVHGGQEGLRARFDYDPYGRKTTLAGISDVTFGYTGHFHHQSSGLHLAMFRALDSAMGRWLSRDPIEESGGLNLYAYAAGDPINATDPLGLFMSSLQTPTGSAVLAWALGGALAGGVAGGLGSGLAESARQAGCQQWNAGNLALAVSGGMRHGMFWGAITGPFLGYLTDVALPAYFLRQAIGRGIPQLDDSISAATPVGRQGQNVKFPNPGEPVPRNAPGTVYGRQYSGHAFDRMQERGLTPSVVENTIQHGRASQGAKPGTLHYVDDVNGINVLTDAATGRVITTW